jgi:hypothetical protein
MGCETIRGSPSTRQTGDSVYRMTGITILLLSRDFSMDVVTAGLLSRCQRIIWFSFIFRIFLHRYLTAKLELLNVRRSNCKMYNDTICALCTLNCVFVTKLSLAISPLVTVFPPNMLCGNMGYQQVWQYRVPSITPY